MREVASGCFGSLRRVSGRIRSTRTTGSEDDDSRQPRRRLGPRPVATWPAAMQSAKLVSSVQFDNKGGAGGTIGLAQFINSAKGDPNALMIGRHGDGRRHLSGQLRR